MLRNPTLTSASPGATEENVAAALASAGFEVKTEEKEPNAEPQREAFESDEAFNAAVEEHRIAQEAAEAEEPEAAAETEEEEQPPARKPSKFAKRIEKITGKLKSENEELKARLAKLESGVKTEDKDAAAAADPNPRPVRSAFGTQEEYEDALIAWGTTRTLEQKSVKEIEDEQKAQAQENYDSYKAGVEEFAAEHDDWEEVMNQNLPVHPDVLFSIFELREAGAAVSYYLGTHPDFVQKLAKMPVRSAVMEVGRLSVKLTPASGSGGTAAGSGDNKQPKRRIPAPVRPVNTSATSQSLSTAEAAKKGDYKAFKRAQRAGR